MAVISKNFRNAAVGTVFGGSLLFTAGMGIAGAEPVPAPVPDGLVNVTQGDTILLESVPADVVVTTVAQLCGPAAPDANLLTQQVDTIGVSQTACTGVPGGDVVVAQNVSAELPASPVVPGTESSVDPAEEPAAPVPPGSEESAEGDTSGSGAAEPLPEEEEETGSPAADESPSATWDPI